MSRSWWQDPSPIPWLLFIVLVVIAAILSHAYLGTGR